MSQPSHQVDEFLHELEALCERHKMRLVPSDWCVIQIHDYRPGRTAIDPAGGFQDMTQHGTGQYHD